MAKAKSYRGKYAGTSMGVATRRDIFTPEQVKRHKEFVKRVPIGRSKPRVSYLDLEAQMFEPEFNLVRKGS